MNSVNLKHYINIIQNELDFLIDESNIAIAVSGGGDSMALLHIVAKMLACNIHVLTVDHCIRDNSFEEVLFVHNFVKHMQKNIFFHSFKWEDRSTRGNLQKNARNARYDLLTNFCIDNDIRYLLTAHHLDDNVETFFMRLVRGVGLKSLSSMQSVYEFRGISLFRPLLSIPIEFLHSYLSFYCIPFIEDSSNKSIKYKRNFYRQVLRNFDDYTSMRGNILHTLSCLKNTSIVVDFYIKNLICTYVMSCLERHKQFILAKIIIHNVPEEVLIEVIIYIFKSIHRDVILKKSAIIALKNHIISNISFSNLIISNCKLSSDRNFIFFSEL